jgi:hypothetical protein
MSRLHFFLVLVALSVALGLRPSNVDAETAVFHCEVKPETSEIYVALTEGTLNLKSEIDNVAIPVETGTLRVVDPSGRIQPASNIPRHVIAQISIWKEVLEYGRPLASVVADLFAASFWSSLDIDLGDVERGKTVQKEIIFPGEIITDDLFASFEIEQQFDAPSGVFLDSYLTMNTDVERIISLTLSATILPEAEVENEDILRGTLILRTSDVESNSMKHPMGIYFRAVDPQDMGSGLLDRKTLLYTGGIMIVLAVGALYLLDLRMSEPKGKMQGKLKIVRDPTGGKSNVSVVDLQLAAHRFKSQSIIFGNGSDADIQLPDESVKPTHFRIFPVHDRSENKIFITPLDGNLIRVGRRKFTMGNSVLEEGTQVTAGRFKFEFEPTDVYRQVEVWAASGKIQRGVLIQQWDLESSGFSIVPFREKLSADQLSGIYHRFTKVNLIKFYRSTTRRWLRNLITLPGRSTSRAIVDFKDGSNIECRLNKYAPGKTKYLFALPTGVDKEIDYYLIIERNVKEITFL